MPLYAYRPTSSQTCEMCDGGFELIQRMNEDRLTECPHCGHPCERLLSRVSFSSSTPTKPNMSNSNLERLGFTQYRRNRDGTYRKSFGKGPDKVTKN